MWRPKLAWPMAEVDITPPVGSSLAGYFEDRESSGVGDAWETILEKGNPDIVKTSWSVFLPAPAATSTTLIL